MRQLEYLLARICFKLGRRYNLSMNQMVIEIGSMFNWIGRRLDKAARKTRV